MIHEALPHELPAADRVACRAYAEYEKDFPEWIPYLRRGLPMTELAREAQVLVAQIDGAIAGAVGYVAPHRKKHDVFAPEWAALRFMAMATALALYLKMGFRHERSMAPVMGMPAEVLALRIER